MSSSRLSLSVFHYSCWDLFIMCLNSFLNFFKSWVFFPVSSGFCESTIGQRRYAIFLQVTLNSSLFFCLHRRSTDTVSLFFSFFGYNELKSCASFRIRVKSFTSALSLLKIVRLIIFSSFFVSSSGPFMYSNSFGGFFLWRSRRLYTYGDSGFPHRLCANFVYSVLW